MNKRRYIITKMIGRQPASGLVPEVEVKLFPDLETGNAADILFLAQTVNQDFLLISWVYAVTS